ncbi:hypothetical protein D918_03243 [Trichuris suis]|nr:hypothetical protein D918_03243 [Trichuris suis]
MAKRLSIVTTTWAQVMLLTSLGVFAFAVLLLFALGPKSGPCHPPVSDKCIKTLLAFFTCFAHSIALLASIVFLVLFIVGANLHLLCRPLEDLEAAKGYVGSSLSNEGGSDRLPFFDNADIVSVVDRLSVKEIIRGCKKRETVFVILKLNTLKLPSKLAHMFVNGRRSFIENSEIWQDPKSGSSSNVYVTSETENLTPETPCDVL